MISQSEQNQRIELARTYRMFAYLGWTELIYNHISVRCADHPEHFLLNPFGLHYSEVTAKNLVKIDLSGKVIDSPEGHPINPAGFIIHSALHGQVDKAHCVMHTHTTAGLAVACQKRGLVNHNFYSAQLHGHIAYHDFEGISMYTEERTRLAQNLQGRNCLILRNHGLLSHGETVAQAFAFLWTLNRACEIQVAVEQIGSPDDIIPISDEVAKRCTADSLQFDPRFGGGQNIIDALFRLTIKQYGDVV